jgi:hypothetical protein
MKMKAMEGFGCSYTLGKKIRHSSKTRSRYAAGGNKTAAVN